MTEKVKVEQVVTSGGYSISAAGVTMVTFKCKYGELVNTVQMLQLLNNDIDIVANVPGEKEKAVGHYFRLKQITVDGDGEQTIKLQGVSEFTEVDTLSMLPFKNAEIPEFRITLSSSIELETEDDEEDEWGDEDDWDE